MLRATALVLVGLALAAAPPAHARRKPSHDLLRVIAPVARGTAPAHPFVNVIVRFGSAADGSPADPTTFRARLGKTPLRLDPMVEDGKTVGMRGTIEPGLLKLGARRSNHLRLEVRTVAKPGRTKGSRDVDRIRFRAVEAENQAPTAHLLVASDVVFPDIPTQFDGSQSTDPESDLLTYVWDFGDGLPRSTDPQPRHAFPGGTEDVTVRLTVSDGDQSSTDQITLVGCPPLDPGKTPGTLQVTADQSLEFGAATAPSTRPFMVTNVATASESQLHVRIGVDGPGFVADPAELRLGPGEAAPISVTFTPGETGHHTAEIAVVACATNRDAVHVLVHGYAGDAPGKGPTLAAEPLFFNGIGFGAGVSMLLPSGQQVPANNVTHFCQVPLNGLGTGDVCLVDADCAANGGTCVQSSSVVFDPVDLCADGTGGVYLISDEGTFTDANPLDDTDTSVTILRQRFDANGSPIDTAIIARTTSDTTQIACDGTAAADGGRLFTAEARSVNLTQCFRDQQEQLAVTPKDGGSSPSVLLPRIDAVAGQEFCNGDLDAVADLAVTRDGSAVFASLIDSGLFQLRPTPRLITPDVSEAFLVHPDGNLIVVTATDTGTRGVLNVYKLFPEQAADGALRLADLAPCATFPIPNNRPPGSTLRTTLLGEHSFAVGRATLASLDGTVLVSFFSNGGLQAPPGQPAPLARQLRVQGVAAFASPAGADPCRPLGLISLDLIDQLAF